MPGPLGPWALALCLYSLDLAGAVAAAVAVAAVATSVTSLPRAHYHLEHISTKMPVFDTTLQNPTYLTMFSKNGLSMAFPASGTYLARTAAKFYS